MQFLGIDGVAKAGGLYRDRATATEGVRNFLPRSEMIISCPE